MTTDKTQDERGEFEPCPRCGNTLGTYRTPYGKMACVGCGLLLGDAPERNEMNGWKLVPVESSMEMVWAAQKFVEETERRSKGHWWWKRLYEAYLAAAPEPAASQAQTAQPVAYRWRIHTDDSLAGKPNVRPWLFSHDKPPTDMCEVELLYAAPPSELREALLERAADMLTAYGELIRRDGASRIEEHHYLPEVEFLVSELRAILRSTDHG